MILKDEKLFLETRQSKKLPNFILAVILAYAFVFVGQFIGGTILHILFSLDLGWDFNNALLMQFLNLTIGFVFIIILVFLVVKFIGKRSVTTMGLKKENLLLNYLRGFGVGILLMSLVVALLYLTGCVEIEKNVLQPVGKFAILNVLIILPGWIIQSAAEEIVTRGWLMNVLGARYNGIIALIVSASLFGLLHLGNPNISFIAILNIILSGLLFGLYVIKTKDLWGACGIHAAWNFAQGNIFGFEVSGLPMKAGSIIDLRLVGNDMFSGGIFGPEAGLAGTIVLGVSILVLIYMIKKEKETLSNSKITMLK